MARFGFAAIVAMLLGVGLAVSVTPEAPGPESPEPAPTASPPEVRDLVAAPSVAEPTEPETPSAPEPELAREVEAPPKVETPAPREPEPEVVADAPVLGIPSLPEEQREVAAPLAFEEGELEAQAEAPAAAPPVDPERSGDLIRRMLVLYRQMGE